MEKVSVIQGGPASDSASEADSNFMEAIVFFHDVIQDWIQDPQTTIACGCWADGAVSEIIPAGRAQLLPARYQGCFAGVREILLDDGPHHLHIDLGRVHKVSYAIAPSVCLAFKPALEVRLLITGPGGAPTDRWVLSLMPDCPYRGDQLDETVVHHFVERLRLHAKRAPELVELSIEPEVRKGPQGVVLLGLMRKAVAQLDADWDEVMQALIPAHNHSPAKEMMEPPCLPLLREALDLCESSFVIYRERTLVEFQVEKINGVHRYMEQGHASWQIGGLKDHHCHLALGAVHRVLFSAEPVSCQGGGLNYTIWFLTSGPCGNPWRRDGYFSVVLNRPYTGNVPRLEVIKPVLELYLRYCNEPWVNADERFISALEQGVPDRRQQKLVSVRSE